MWVARNPYVAGRSDCYLLHAIVLLDLSFNPEDGDDILLRNLI
jgi:hypothetical protein